MAALFSFEYRVDNWSSIQMETLAQLVHLNFQDMCSDSSNQMKLLAGSELKTEEEHLKIEIVAALLICNASTILIIGKCETW